MRKTLILIIALVSIFAVVAQYVLMLNNNTFGIPETTVRFFSYFTILSNSLVAFYFSRLFIKSVFNPLPPKNNFGILTAITVYITIVGLVYQVLLRQIWSPTGLQKVVDELLHSVIPALVIVYWFINRTGHRLKYSDLIPWLAFPLFYLIFVSIRGNFSGFYPYPFLDIKTIGFNQVLINSLSMTGLFVIVSAIFIWISKKFKTLT
ncbi:MAG TPA: Pr6Pr family membrane protein [Chitinophagaceae bacterium]|nr:Pr6Pr family membrane protein [Chitinophagaceae bacterium]